MAYSAARAYVSAPGKAAEANDTTASTKTRDIAPSQKQRSLCVATIASIAHSIFQNASRVRVYGIRVGTYVAQSLHGGVTCRHHIDPIIASLAIDANFYSATRGLCYPLRAVTTTMGSPSSSGETSFTSTCAKPAWCRYAPTTQARPALFSARHNRIT